MPDNRKLILDTHCEIYDMIKNHAAGLFWDFKRHVAEGKLVSGAVYVIGREQMRLNSALVRQLINDGTIDVIFSNPAEGSAAIKGHLIQYGILDLVESRKISVISGGDQEPSWSYLRYDSFLHKVLEYKENLQAITDYQEQYTLDRPYKFLFLNGRARPHRKYLLERFRVTGLLDQTIWSNLDSRAGPALMAQENNSLSFMYEDTDLVLQSLDIKYLDLKYEVKSYCKDTEKLATRGFVKPELFNNTWGDILLRTEPYLDTYFSLVTETVYMYPYSFRTEKLWKPVAIGHPFIVAASQGYYRDLRNLGFRTFGHLIDESFDQIENDQQRIEHTAKVVEDLCNQDLDSFLSAAQEVCKYNQQHLAETRIKVLSEFPGRFSQFIKQYNSNE